MEGYVIIISASLAWILFNNPLWLTNHWNHWLFGNFFDNTKD